MTAIGFSPSCKQSFLAVFPFASLDPLVYWGIRARETVPDVFEPIVGSWGKFSLK